FTATLRDSYQLISSALVKGLELMGLTARLAPAAPPAYARGLMPCFAYPARDEIEIGGRKIVGSAQKRTAGAFLQHGSVPLESDEALLKSIARSEVEGGEVSMTSLSEVLGRPATFEWAAFHFTMGISDFFGIKVEPYVFDEADRRAIARLEAERYGNDEWTFRARTKATRL
ncbi:MAG: lipoate--protein ligase family protein, partial [Candidatus Aminicenantales bacterium]